MSIISTNFLLARIAAFFLIFFLSALTVFITGLFFDFSELWMVVSGLALSAFLGAFNVVEPKSVQMEFDKFKKLIDNFNER